MTSPQQRSSAAPTRIHLRVKHPKLDPKEITRVLSMTPEHTLDASRCAVSTAAESYWIAPLNFSGLEEPWPKSGEQNDDFGENTFPPFSTLQMLSDESIVGLALRRLQLHQRFFRSIEDEGGTATLLINVNKAGSMTIPPRIARKLADLGLTLELDWSDSVE
jgi:hypothetical protein